MLTNGIGNAQIFPTFRIYFLQNDVSLCLSLSMSSTLRKRWILYPPWESSYLYPTRIPYEESSVFSEVNVKNPDFERHPLFKVFHEARNLLTMI